MKFKVGDKIKCINREEETNTKDITYGKIYEITEENEFFVCFKDDNRDYRHRPAENYELLLQNISKTNIMTKLNSMMKRLLDADTKKLIKGGLINGDLQLTEEGKEALLSIIFEEKKADLVKVAEENIAEAEKEKCC